MWEAADRIEELELSQQNIDGQIADAFRDGHRAARPVVVTDGWRPIEMAPKDGTYVAVARDMGAPWGWVRGVAYYVECGEIAGWVPICGFSEPPGVLGLAQPTHWQPLPAPPSHARGE